MAFWVGDLDDSSSSEGSMPYGWRIKDPILREYAGRVEKKYRRILFYPPKKQVEGPTVRVRVTEVTEDPPWKKEVTPLPSQGGSLMPSGGTKGDSASMEQPLIKNYSKSGSPMLNPEISKVSENSRSSQNPESGNPFMIPPGIITGALDRVEAQVTDMLSTPVIKPPNQTSKGLDNVKDLARSINHREVDPVVEVKSADRPNHRIGGQGSSALVTGVDIKHRVSSDDSTVDKHSLPLSNNTSQSSLILPAIAHSLKHSTPQKKIEFKKKIITKKNFLKIVRILGIWLNLGWCHLRK